MPGQVSVFNYQAISKMPEYAQKSFEELRYEDYMKGNKGSNPQQPAAAGGLFGQPAAGASPFGAAPAAASPFGAAPAAASPFGACGAAPAASPFGAPAAPAFGATPSPFGAPAAPKPAGLFGAPGAPETHEVRRLCVPDDATGGDIGAELLAVVRDQLAPGAAARFASLDAHPRAAALEDMLAAAGFRAAREAPA